MVSSSPWPGREERGEFWTVTAIVSLEADGRIGDTT